MRSSLTRMNDVLVTFRRPFLACSVALGLSASAGTPRDLLPPASPKFSAHAGAAFVDDFRSGKLDQWHADRRGVWSVRRGMLVAQLPDAKQQHSLIYAGDSTWTDYAVDLDVCGIRGVDKGVVVRVNGERGIGIDLRGPGYEDLKVHLNEFPIARAAFSNANSEWHHLRIELRGPRCRVVVDDQEVVSRKLPTSAPSRGGLALAAYTGGVAECTVYYDNIMVTSLAQSSGKP